MAEPHELLIERRLATLETLLRTIDARLKQNELDHKTTAEDYQKLKNRGAGLLIGVGLLAGAIGSKMDAIVARIFS